MTHSGIRVVAFFAGAMGILVALVATGQAFLRFGPPAGPAPSVDALVPVSLAFLSICVLSGMAAAALKAQADQIADLQRRLPHGASMK